MLSQRLFRQVLIDPVRSHEASRLLIVSGYATANMADYHLIRLKEGHLYTPVDVSLIVGMTVTGGISRAHHLGFARLASAEPPTGPRFSCRYVVTGNPVHAKVYTWLKDGQPVQAFAGSPNYTLTGFGESQLEAVAEIDPHAGFDLYHRIRAETASCIDVGIEERVWLQDYADAKSVGRLRRQEVGDGVKLPLVKQDGETHRRAGLNWGQRPGRNRNQAYIPIPATHYDYFPPIGDRFVVQTDDDQSLIMVRAQERGKALHTPDDNSILGIYFRNRIGVPSGQYVNREHLDRYGRIDVSFSRIDAETYMMDFGV